MRVYFCVSLGCDHGTAYVDSSTPEPQRRSVPSQQRTRDQIICRKISDIIGGVTSICIVCLVAVMTNDHGEPVHAVNLLVAIALSGVLAVSLDGFTDTFAAPVDRPAHRGTAVVDVDETANSEAVEGDAMKGVSPAKQGEDKAVDYPSDSESKQEQVKPVDHQSNSEPKQEQVKAAEQQSINEAVTPARPLKPDDPSTSAAIRQMNSEFRKSAPTPSESPQTPTRQSKFHHDDDVRSENSSVGENVRNGDDDKVTYFER